MSPCSRNGNLNNLLAPTILAQLCLVHKFRVQWSVSRTTSFTYFKQSKSNIGRRSTANNCISTTWERYHPHYRVPHMQILLKCVALNTISYKREMVNKHYTTAGVAANAREICNIL